MTALQLYEAVLVELNKVKAPSLSLNDFIYFANKSVLQYANYIYNVYEVTQQQVDDLRALRGTAKLKLEADERSSEPHDMALYKGVFETELPDDYWHILNCVVEFEWDSKVKRCADEDRTFAVGAKRLNSDASPQVITNYYFKPSYKNPYFYIINNPNTNNEFKAHDSIEAIEPHYTVYKLSLPKKKENTVTFRFDKGNYSKEIVIDTPVELYRSLLRLKNRSTDENYFQKMDIKFEDDTILYISAPLLEGVVINGQVASATEDINYLRDKVSYARYGNPTKTRMEIRCGKLKNMAPKFVYVDYLRAPQYISITQEQIDDNEDNSQLLEFSDYVCYEIINWMIKLIMENSSNPRMPNTTAVNLSIGSPGSNNK